MSRELLYPDEYICDGCHIKFDLRKDGGSVCLSTPSGEGKALCTECNRAKLQSDLEWLKKLYVH